MIFEVIEVIEVIKGDVDSRRVSLLRHRTDTLEGGGTLELACLEELPSPSYYDTIRVGDHCLLRVGRYSTGWHVVDGIGEGLSRTVAGEADPFVQAMRVLARIVDPTARLDSIRAAAVTPLLVRDPVRARLLRSIALAVRAGEPVDRALLEQLGCR